MKSVFWYKFCTNLNKFVTKKLTLSYIICIPTQESYINNTNLHCIPKNGLGCLVAFSVSYVTDIEKKFWCLGILLFLSYEKIVIIPSESIDHRFGHNDHRRYGISDGKVYCHKFNNYDRIKLHYLNVIHKGMSIGDDGFIQSSINGPDIILRMPGLPSKILYDKYTNYSKGSKEWFTLEDVDVYERMRTKLSFFNSKKNIKRKLNPTKSIYVPLHKYHKRYGFAFPYLMNPCSNECDIVVFAILDYDRSRDLIYRTKIEKAEYETYLDDFKIDTIRCQVIRVGNEGIAIKRKGLGDIFDSKQDSPIWRQNSIQIGIWKKTPTVKINNLNYMKEILQRTYGNFGFNRSTSKCFGLNTYTGTVT